MPAHVNREAVRDRRERLVDEYGVPVHEERELVEDGDLFAELDALVRDGYTGGGYAWVIRDPEQAPPLTESMPDQVDERPAVLMIKHRGGRRWGLPGGGREDGESYEDAAVREVREETGIDCELTGAFALIHRRTVHPDGDETLHTLWAFFDATYRGGRVEVQPGELSGAAWFYDPPEPMHPENRYRAADSWEGYEADDPLADRTD